MTFLWTIFWSIYEHRKRTTPELDVRAGWSFMTVGPDVTFLGVTVTNVGQPGVTLEELKVEMKGASDHLSLNSWYQRSGPLPVHLPTGGTWSGSYEWSLIEEQLPRLGANRKIRVAARDSTGRLHREKWRTWQ